MPEIPIDTPGAGPERSGPDEGEGSQAGARQYVESTRAFIVSGKIMQAADDAPQDVSGREAEALNRAEAEGKKHGHGEEKAQPR